MRWDSKSHWLGALAATDRAPAATRGIATIQGPDQAPHRPAPSVAQDPSWAPSSSCWPFPLKHNVKGLCWTPYRARPFRRLIIHNPLGQTGPSPGTRTYRPAAGKLVPLVGQSQRACVPCGPPYTECRSRTMLSTHSKGPGTIPVGLDPGEGL